MPTEYDSMVLYALPFLLYAHTTTLNLLYLLVSVFFSFQNSFTYSV